MTGIYSPKILEVVEETSADIEAPTRRTDTTIVHNTFIGMGRGIRH